MSDATPTAEEHPSWRRHKRSVEPRLSSLAISIEALAPDEIDKATRECRFSKDAMDEGEHQLTLPTQAEVMAPIIEAQQQAAKSDFEQLLLRVGEAYRNAKGKK